MRSKLREALTQVLAELRPSWDADGIREALDHRDIAAVNENLVVLAAVRAATDRNVRSPGVIPSPGPHWDEKPANPSRPTPHYERPRPLTAAELDAADVARAAAKTALRQAIDDAQQARAARSGVS